MIGAGFPASSIKAREAEYNLSRMAMSLVTNRKPNLRQQLKRGFWWTIAGIVGIAAISFALDYAILEIRVLTKRNPYGSVTVNHYYAVLQKNGKTEFIFDPPAPQTCVNALFPHGGALPCWYLSRHPDQRTDI